MARKERCLDCGRRYAIGEWPYCPHGTASPTKGYEPHWDYHITDTPVWISNPGDKKKYLKAVWENDHIRHTIERD